MYVCMYVYIEMYVYVYLWIYIQRRQLIREKTKFAF